VPPPPPPPPPTYGGAPPPPGGAAPPSGDTKSPNRGLMLVLSYLGLLALIPLLVEKEDREVQWHAKHGLVLTAASFVLSFAIWLMTFMLALTGIDVLGCLGCFMWPVIWLGILVVFVVCMVKALNGERMMIPGISQYADKF
jgi:uncharacterized membrane protein